MKAHDLLNLAENLAPTPYQRDQVSTEAWLRHYIALALAAHTAFRDGMGAALREDPVSRPDLGYIVTIATAATAAAIALDTPPDTVAWRLWKLTPEAGSLNGEYLRWLTDRADQLGINPADLDHRLEPGDFSSASRTTRILRATGDTPPTGDPISVDVAKDGATIFTTEGTRS